MNDSGAPSYGYPHYDNSEGVEWITIKELRRRLCVSDKFVNEHIDKGDIECEARGGVKTVEWYTTCKSLAQKIGRPMYLHPNEIQERRRRKERRKARKRQQVAEQIHASHQAERLQPPAVPLVPEYRERRKGESEFHEGMSKREADAIKQVYQAKQAKLKYLRDAGILINATKVRNEWEEIAIRVRKAMLSIPDRVAQLYSTISDPTEIHKNLTTEISHGLTRLSYEVESDKESVTNFEAQTEVSPTYVEEQTEDDDEE